MAYYTTWRAKLTPSLYPILFTAGHTIEQQRHSQIIMLQPISCLFQERVIDKMVMIRQFEFFRSGEVKFHLSKTLS